MNRLASLAVLALVPLVGCSNHVVSIGITVVTESCGGAAKPTEGVDTYRAVITGSQMEPITQTFAAGGQVQFEQIPPGEGRVLALTGYAGDPDNGGTPLAFGQTVPFTVPDNPDSPVTATVVLRKVNTFAGVPTVEDPSTCAKLTIPRAGHTATLMNDGRVLIAGGFSLNPGTDSSIDAGGDPRNWAFHDEAEIFDPATNTSQSVAKMVAFNLSSVGYDSPGAFAAASRLGDGSVMISGGETYSFGFGARSNTMTYDPSSNSWYEGIMSAPGFDFPDGGQRTLERSHHIQVTNSDGQVLIAGGIRYDRSTRQPTLASEPIWIDPATGQFQAVTQKDGSAYSFARANASATLVLGGSAIAVGGGDLLDGGLADQPVVFFDLADDGGWLAYAGGLDSSAADPPRSHGVIAGLGPEQTLVVLAGGFGSDGSLLTSSGVMDATAAGTQFALAPVAGRSDGCAVTLPDGRAVVIGGELAEVPPATSPAVDVYQESFYQLLAPHVSDAGAKIDDFTPPFSTPALLDSRKWQTCTVLQDGSVLVTGGVKEEAGKFEVLDTIELYTPVPL